MNNNTKSNPLRSLFSNHSQECVLICLILAVSFLVQLRTGGSFLSASNLNELMREASMLMIVSIGMTIVIVSGGIDLSVGSVMGLAGMISVLVLRDHPQIPVILVFAIGIGVGLICGVISGFVVAKLRIAPLIGTLGTCDIFRGVIYLFSKGEWVSQTDMTPEFLAISTSKFLGINYMVLFAIAVAIFGIKVERNKWIAYVISGMIAGFAGVLWVCKYACAQGTTATSFELNVIASVVLGGVSITGGAGSMYGVLLGSLLFGILNNILPLIQVSSFWQRAIRGAVILISVVINSLVLRRASRKALIRREEHEKA